MQEKTREKHSLFIATGAILFISAALPIVSSLADLVVSKINCKIQKMQLNLELDAREVQAAAETIKPSESITQAIGFALPNEQIYEDDEYE